MRHRTWIEIWKYIKREYKRTENKKANSETSERENQTAEEKRHIPETSEILDEKTEDNTDIFNTCHRQGSTTQENRKISHKEDWKEEYKVKIYSATIVVKGLTLTLHVEAWTNWVPVCVILFIFHYGWNWN